MYVYHNGKWVQVTAADMVSAIQLNAMVSNLNDETKIKQKHPAQSQED